jgi:hypothetical protein
MIMIHDRQSSHLILLLSIDIGLYTPYKTRPRPHGVHLPLARSHCCLIFSVSISVFPEHYGIIITTLAV